MKKRLRFIFVLTVFLLACLFPSPSMGAAKTFTDQLPIPESREQLAATPVTILVDDFKPQHYQGDPIYFYNRLNGDRGALNDGVVQWENGKVRAAVSAGKTWTGIWESLNHPDIEHLPINFSAILPPQILPAYQSQITGITVKIAGGTVGRQFRVELKNGETPIWSISIGLSGGAQTIDKALPALGNISQIVLVLDNAVQGDFVTIERISLTATTQIPASPGKAFVWSYAMLLANWDPVTGLVRDVAKAPSGDFDAIQSTGSLAAATALAEQLGVISHDSAVAIVNKISDTLLNDIPRFHGLWPHWVVSENGTFSILGPDGVNDITGLDCQPGACTDHNGDGLNDVTRQPCNPSVCTDIGTEWSSVDTVIAALGLLNAQEALGLDTSMTEQILKTIDWNQLKTPNGISHGYDYAGLLIPYTWDAFGGESWLVNLAYASATGKIAQITFGSPPTANGSGFIDELAWLFVPAPSSPDAWGTDWSLYRAGAAETQISYYPGHYPTSCFTQWGLFGLSAGEVPDPSLVAKKNIYQAFGVGGRFVNVNNGSDTMGAPVVTPHYSAMLAPFRSQEAILMWDRLITQGYFSPLNNVESLMYTPVNSGCTSTAVFNDLKGSWNLALQTLGWGNYLAQKKGEDPSTWLAVGQNAFLRGGYLLLTAERTVAKIHAAIGGTLRGSYTLASGESTRQSYPSLDTGPAKLTSTSGVPFIAAERVIYKANGVNTSFSEMMGLPSSLLDKTYWLPWYNNVELDTQLRFANAGNSTATVHVYIGGTEMQGSPFALAAGASTRRSFPGVNNGPVKIVSDVNIVAAERVGYSVNGINTSFSEMMALPNSQLSKTYWLPWYNNMELDTQLRIANVSGSTASVRVYIGGIETPGSPFNLAAGASTRKSFAVNNGPVKIVSNQNIVVAERIIYKVNNVNTSFTEMMALPSGQLNTAYWLPWYNNTGDLDTQLRFANVTGSTATVHVYIGGVEMPGSPFTLAAGASTRKSFAGINRGPVQITSNVNIVAAQRAIYKVNNINTSFAEMMALPQSQLSTTYWLPWYNNISLDTQLRFGVP